MCRVASGAGRPARPPAVWHARGGRLPPRLHHQLALLQHQRGPDRGLHQAVSVLGLGSGLKPGFLIVVFCRHSGSEPDGILPPGLAWQAAPPAHLWSAQSAPRLVRTACCPAALFVPPTALRPCSYRLLPCGPSAVPGQPPGTGAAPAHGHLSCAPPCSAHCAGAWLTCGPASSAHPCRPRRHSWTVRAPMTCTRRSGAESLFGAGAAIV